MNSNAVQGSSVRERVLDALMEIIAERGLDQVTIREVASTAGVSIGSVQYYCRSKEEMLRLAFEHVIESALGRADAIARTGDVSAVLRTALREFMPLDERRRRETKVYLAFAARALVADDLAAVLHGIMVRLRNLCAEAYRLAEQRGQTWGDADAELFGAATVALLDGINLHLLSDPAGLDEQAALAITDLHLTHYFRLSDAPVATSARP